LTTETTTGLNVQLPWFVLPVRCNVVAKSVDGEVFVISQDPEDHEEEIILDRGAYRVKFDVVTSHQVIIKEVRYIIVGAGNPFWTTRVD
jgi:hypothetical protein